jgi:hypothetical protein
MFGKLGMSLRECIAAFEDFVYEIYGDPQLSLSGGLRTPKYQDSKLDEWIDAVLEKECGKIDLLMTDKPERGGTEW